MPLERKIQISQTRIIEWYNHYHGNVVVSFSGGKDSTVLLHLVRSIFPDVKAVFSNTGLEYPEIQKHVMSIDNVDIVRPTMRFDEVISTYGYPLIGKEVAEAIYYARRIRSQSGNVERERERERERRTAERKQRELSGQRLYTSEQHSEENGYRTVTNRGGAERPSESGRDSQCQAAEESSHRDKHCKEQTNSSDRADAGIRNGAGVVVKPLTMGGVLRDHPKKGRHPSSGKWEDYHRTILAPDRDNPRSREINWNRKAGIAPTGQTGEGGVFSNPEEQFGQKSQFNKEKWLPLVYTPFMISHYCCHKMKKSPMKKYQHEHHLYPILGTLAEESRVRKQAWIRHGCNAFDSASPSSQPLSFWTEQDILAYIVKYDLPIASVYGDIVSVQDGNEYPAKDMTGQIGCNLKCTGCDRTGCIFCGFGFHLEKKGETRFQRLAKTHPRQYEFSIGGGQWVDNPYYDPVAPEYDGQWKNWNPKKIWVPSKKGLGMGKVFDLANEIYGKDFYRYE